MISWFSSTASVRFGQELAVFLLSEFSGSVPKRNAKFSAKAEKALVRADQRVREFRVRERMNFYKRAKLANAFLWKLKDGGCSEEYANELTEWLTMRL
ncbi:MAG: hypothetical protein JWQ76_2510 [Ramlibacter sp.]|nr:hypothetical protein [Ramlibacter sp.]